MTGANAREAIVAGGASGISRAPAGTLDVVVNTAGFGGAMVSLSSLNGRQAAAAMSAYCAAKAGLSNPDVYGHALKLATQQ